ncbi:NnrS family protein [Undibacterium sp.]|uniref:NnrS family protein n=1 Tax=Undibacterium sp. TaxID=1914977 RepID=UPI002730A5CF|nr:NnrS family protein [Undibacterium sp.]MDP1977459.1 NnrS family protein [Undibacterium sp.]
MKRLALAPHRLYFFLGALAVALLFSWWWWQVQAQQMQTIALHALVMPLGVFPLFILGFTFTAGPRWLGLDVPDHYFLLHGVTYFMGVALVLLASALGWHPLRSSGFAFMLSAWLAVTWRWAALVRMSKVDDKIHPIALLFAMTGGALALVASLLWSLGMQETWQVGRELAFFGFLLPVFLTVCHRMLPFFTSNVLQDYVVWRPYRLLYVWLGGSALLALTACLNLLLVQAVVAGLMSLSFAYTSWRWGLLRSLQNRLLAMLHLSFAWLMVVFALQAATALGAPIGSAAVHALGLGFMGTMLVGFVSRVTFGHSGRALQANNLLWGLYLGLHIAALLRVMASLFVIPQILQLSSSIWLALLLIWTAQMLPAYLRARADGKAG